jgi:hypothetical protein
MICVHVFVQQLCTIQSKTTKNNLEVHNFLCLFCVCVCVCVCVLLLGILMRSCTHECMWHTDKCTCTKVEAHDALS